MKTILLIWLLIISDAKEYDYEYIKIVNLLRLPIVEVTLNGKKAFFLLDTGSAISMLNEKDTSKYGFKEFRSEHQDHKAVGIGGTTTSFKSAFKVKLMLGSSRIMTQYMVHDISPIVSQINKNVGVEISGILGSDVMKRYGIVIDYKNKRIGVMVSKKMVKENEIVVGR